MTITVHHETGTEQIEFDKDRCLVLRRRTILKEPKRFDDWEDNSSEEEEPEPIVQPGSGKKASKKPIVSKDKIGGWKYKKIPDASPEARRMLRVQKTTVDGRLTTFYIGLPPGRKNVVVDLRWQVPKVF